MMQKRRIDEEAMVSVYLTRSWVESEVAFFLIKCFKPRGRVSSLFTVAFLLFLAPAGISNPAGQFSNTVGAIISP